jgi:hypothetical protein
LLAPFRYKVNPAKAWFDVSQEGICQQCKPPKRAKEGEVALVWDVLNPL